MILEERISFYDEEDASEFIDFLKKEGCKAQKQTYSEGIIEENLVGKVKDIINWLEEPETSEYYILENDLESAKEQLRNIVINVNKITENQNAGEVLFKNENIEESKELFLKIYKEKYESYIEQFSDDSEESTEETVTNDDIKEPKKLSEAKNTESDNESPGSAELAETEKLQDQELIDNPLDEIEVPEFIYYNMLIEQGFVEKSEEGYIAPKEIDSGDIQINLTLHRVNLPEDFQAGEIVRQMHYELTTKYLVKIDPSVHLYCNNEELIDLIYELDYDEDEAIQLIKNLSIKKHIIYRLLDVVSENNGIPVEELAEEINETAIRNTEDNSGFDITLTDKEISMIVSELRKIGILSGTDKKIKLADKKKRRQR